VSAATTNPGSMMPHSITLADVAAMADADEHHKYELTPEGALVVMTPPTLEHQRIVGRLFAWLLSHGYGPDQVISEVGIYTGGGRQPDLTVWSDADAPQPVEASYCGTSGLLLVIEVVSKSSEIEDKVRKRAEYARAGIARYWIIEQDQPQTITMLRLDDHGAYRAALPSPQPLRWVLTTDPQDYLAV
jgi:Uma2 family endonuclease